MAKKRLTDELDPQTPDAPEEEDVPRNMSISLFIKKALGLTPLVEGQPLGVITDGPPPPAKPAFDMKPAVPLREQAIKVDLMANGQYKLIAAPVGWWFDRRITQTVTGQKGSAETGWEAYQVTVNLEHVDDDADGVWCYRAM